MQFKAGDIIRWRYPKREEERSQTFIVESDFDTNNEYGFVKMPIIANGGFRLYRSYFTPDDLELDPFLTAVYAEKNSIP